MSIQTCDEKDVVFDSPEGIHTCYELCGRLTLLRGDTHLLPTVWKELRLPSVGFAFHEAKASCFRTTASPQASVNHGWEEG